MTAWRRGYKRGWRKVERKQAFNDNWLSDFIGYVIGSTFQVMSVQSVACKDNLANNLNLISVRTLIIWLNIELLFISLVNELASLQSLTLALGFSFI